MSVFRITAGIASSPFLFPVCWYTICWHVNRPLLLSISAARIEPMTQTAAPDLRIDKPPQTIREMALERMRSAIISGYFQSGARMVERSLCDQLGVSRSVVRSEERRVGQAGGRVGWLRDV